MTSSPGGPRASLLISVPVGSESAAGPATDASWSVALNAEASVASPVGVSVEPDALLLNEICAWSGAGADTAEPSGLPLVSLLRLGASDVTEDSETTPDASGASVVVGAEGVSMVVATGVTCAVRSGADSSIVEGSPAPAPLEEIEPWLAVSHRRGCGDCVVVGAVEAGAQPSSLVAAAAVSFVAVAAVVSVGGVACALDAPASEGIAGIVPIESS